MPAAAPNLSHDDLDDEVPTFDAGCPRGYSANPARVVRGPVVQLVFPVGARGGDFLGTDEARAFANAILAAADVADRNG